MPEIDTFKLTKTSMAPVFNVAPRSGRMVLRIK
jgi:hypothetical protein